MKTEQRIYSHDKGWVKLTDNNLSEISQLVLVFGNKDLLKDQQNIDYLKLQYPMAQIIGCSTSGEICGDEVYDQNIVCTALWFENSRV